MRKIRAIDVHHPNDGHTDEVRRHPAFAQISVARGQTNGRALYGSDFRHRNIMTVRICESEEMRGLSHDYHHEGRVVAEVAMSEAQWATFISSPNMGGGVPCTLRARDTDYLVPELPDPADQVAQFKGEVSQTVRDGIDHLLNLRGLVEKMGLSKKATAQIVGLLDRSVQELEANLPYVAKTFGEHVEKTIERAKIEINAYAVTTLHRAGIGAIAGGSAAAPITFAPAGEEKNP